MVKHLAQLLLDRENDILAANAADIRTAKDSGNVQIQFTHTSLAQMVFHDTAS